MGKKPVAGNKHIENVGRRAKRLSVPSVLCTTSIIYMAATASYLLADIYVKVFGDFQVHYFLRAEIIAKPISFLIASLAVCLWRFSQGNELQRDHKSEIIHGVTAGFFAFLFFYFAFPITVALFGTNLEDLYYPLMLTGNLISLRENYLIHNPEGFRGWCLAIGTGIALISVLWAGTCLIALLILNVWKRWKTGYTVKQKTWAIVWAVLLPIHILLSKTICCGSH